MYIVLCFTHHHRYIRHHYSRHYMYMCTILVCYHKLHHHHRNSVSRPHIRQYLHGKHVLLSHFNHTEIIWGIWSNEFRKYWLEQETSLSFSNLCLCFWYVLRHDTFFIIHFQSWPFLKYKYQVSGKTIPWFTTTIII